MMTRCRASRYCHALARRARRAQKRVCPDVTEKHMTGSEGKVFALNDVKILLVKSNNYASP